MVYNNEKEFKSIFDELKEVKYTKEMKGLQLKLEPASSGPCADHPQFPSAISIYNPRHNILGLFNISLRSESSQVKRYLISSIANLVHELPHELLKDLRLNAQSSFQKLNVDNSCQKTRKIRYCILEVLSNFNVFP